MRDAFEVQDKCGFRAGDANLHRYAGNDPTDFSDPSGLKGKSCGGNRHRGGKRDRRPEGKQP
jgi:hypothetical protein